MFKIHLSPVETDHERDSIGGRPILPAELPWPHCGRCEARQTLFFQLDIPTTEDVPAPFGGHHLNFFHCPSCNDIPTLYGGGALPPGYFDSPRHWTGVMHKATREVVHQADPYLLEQRIVLTKATEAIDASGYGDYGFKLGGVPYWCQDVESWTCSCGTPMTFLVQIGVNQPFEKRPEAPEQPDSFSCDDYGPFLGNAVYMFACPRLCHPKSIMVSVQN